MPFTLQELLTTECPECGAIKPLEFENTKLMGFHCKCGHCFLKENYPLKNMQLWRKFSNDHKNLFIKLLGKNTNIYTDINDWSFNRGFTYTSFDRKKLIDDILQNDRSVRYASRVCIVRGPILPFIHKENNNLTIDDYEEYHKQKTYKTYATVADEIRSVFYRKLQEYYKEHRKCCVRRDNCFVKKAIATWKGKVFDGHKKFDPRKEERSKLSYDERREQGIKNWEVEYPYIDNGFFRDMVFQYNYPDKEWYYRHILWLRCWDGLIPFLGGGWGYSDDETPIIHRLDRLSDKNFRATMAYSTKRITEAINFIRTSC
ncbi:hypothetical protein [Enterococcus casseliflavus]|uniref:hypothetical protein n=1 Tax=Enterococcus casseliflavus TaxID=37734 RepID=UPI003D0E0B91